MVLPGRVPPWDAAAAEAGCPHRLGLCLAEGPGTSASGRVNSLHIRDPCRGPRCGQVGLTGLSLGDSARGAWVGCSHTQKWYLGRAVGADRAVPMPGAESAGAMGGVPTCGLGAGDAQAICQAEGAADPLQGQDLVMILKKDTMSLVDPLDHSLIHCQPILNIRVWGVGCNNGRCRGTGRARGWGVALPAEGGRHPSNNLSPRLPPQLPRRL